MFHPFQGWNILHLRMEYSIQVPYLAVRCIVCLGRGDVDGFLTVLRDFPFSNVDWDFVEGWALLLSDGSGVTGFA